MDPVKCGGCDEDPSRRATVVVCKNCGLCQKCAAETIFEQEGLCEDCSHQVAIWAVLTLKHHRLI